MIYNWVFGTCHEDINIYPKHLSIKASFKTKSFNPLWLATNFFFTVTTTQSPLYPFYNFTTFISSSHTIQLSLIHHHSYPFPLDYPSRSRCKMQDDNKSCNWARLYISKGHFTLPPAFWSSNDMKDHLARGPLPMWVDAWEKASG